MICDKEFVKKAVKLGKGANELELLVVLTCLRGTGIISLIF